MVTLISTKKCISGSSFLFENELTFTYFYWNGNGSFEYLNPKKLPKECCHLPANGYVTLSLVGR